MSTGSSWITIRGMKVEIVYKDIKNLHIAVYPPDGRVRVSAPMSFDDDRVRLAVIQRLSWINRERHKLTSAPRQSLREMITGESHYLWGRRYRLQVIERPGTAHFEPDGKDLRYYVPADTPAAKRREHLDQWYRQQLRIALPDLISAWEQALKIEVPKWSIRRMKTKWGSCNRETRHIWFNVELAKKHPDCLEYVLVHEMIHYFERHHNQRFTHLMDTHLPDWRSRRDQLNTAPLRNEMWPD